MNNEKEISIKERFNRGTIDLLSFAVAYGLFSIGQDQIDQLNAQISKLHPILDKMIKDPDLTVEQAHQLNYYTKLTLSLLENKQQMEIITWVILATLVVAFFQTFNHYIMGTIDLARELFKEE